MSALEILAVVGVIAYVIYQQVAGAPLRGKRAVLLPAILTVVGFTDLHSAAQRLQAVDVVCIAVGALGSIAVGLAFGAMTRLESRGGHLWAQLPVAGLWLWLALAGWRGLDFVLASAVHAHVAASSSTLLFTLGLNRLAQAAVIVPRARAAGIPFAPEKDGTVFLGQIFDNSRGVSNERGFDNSRGFGNGPGFENGRSFENGMGAEDRSAYGPRRDWYQHSSAAQMWDRTPGYQGDYADDRFGDDYGRDARRDRNWDRAVDRHHDHDRGRDRNHNRDRNRNHRPDHGRDRWDRV